MSDCLTLSYVLFYRDYGKLLDTYFLQELRFLVFFVFLCGLMMSLQTLVESIKNLQWMFKRSSPSAPPTPKILMHEAGEQHNVKQIFLKY